MVEKCVQFQTEAVKNSISNSLVAGAGVKNKIQCFL
jgi:hypothetical protein